MAIIQQLQFRPSLLISVVVVNWNRRDLLRACLQSLYRQQGVEFETIVIDNGSDDGSPEMVSREFAAEGDRPVRLIRNRENRGFCAANNQGILDARGEFVALLNNDAEAGPHWLRALGQVFEGRPEVGMAASKILVYEDPTRIDKVGHLIYLDGQNRGRGTGAPDDGRYDRMEEVLWPDGCAAMYRKRMLDTIGGFDEDFFAYGDDAELGLRARIAGWKCLYAPDAVVRHHRGATLGLQSSRRLELIERNRVLLAVKLFPGSLLWRNGLYYGARLVAGALASFRGAGETALFPGWRGKLHMARALIVGDLQALRLVPRMLRKRRAIRGIRKLSPREVRRLLEQYRMPLTELLK
jgi:GT2 family glycosyltransferase